jgi:hypothetical protein
MGWEQHDKAPHRRAPGIVRGTQKVALFIAKLNKADLLILQNYSWKER